MRYVCLSIVLVFSMLIFYPALKLEAADTGSWSVFFSPEGGCTEAIVKEIRKARTTILVQAYSFTSAPIAQALVEAQKHGVKIEVILDKSNMTDKYSAAVFLLHASIPTMIDAAHAIAHNKIMVIDGETVITGSFNFTKAAEQKNAENLLIITDKSLAEKYISNWKLHASHSEVYRGREGKEIPKETLSQSEDEGVSTPPSDFRHGTKSDALNSPTSTNQNTVLYHGNKSSKVFHDPSCRFYNCKNCTANFSSRKAAIDAGYRPCGICKP
jgi:phosphatidylserine/phosphatidylglycerophosphate/cardiolipin synthase-like enzyme